MSTPLSSPPPPPPPFAPLAIVHQFDQLLESSCEEDLEIRPENGEIILGSVIWRWLIGKKDMCAPRTPVLAVGLASWRLWKGEKRSGEEIENPLHKHCKKIIEVGKKMTAEFDKSHQNLDVYYQHLLIQTVRESITASSPGYKVSGRLMSFEFRRETGTWVLYIVQEGKQEPYLQVVVEQSKLFSGCWKLEESGNACLKSEGDFVEV